MSVRRWLGAATSAAILAASAVALSPTPAIAGEKLVLPPITITLKADGTDPGTQAEIYCVLQPLGVTRVGPDAVAGATANCNALVYSITIGVWLYREGAFAAADGSEKTWTVSNNAAAYAQCTDGYYYAYVAATFRAPWAIPPSVFVDNWSPIYTITGC